MSGLVSRDCVLRSLPVLYLFCVFTCVSARCPRVVDLSEPIGRVIHVSASDGPTSWQLTVYSDRTVELSKLGRRALCRVAPKEHVTALYSLVNSAEFVTAEAAKAMDSHAELVQIEVAGNTRIFLPDEASPPVRRLLIHLDRLFSDVFEGPYDWLLLGPKIGP